MTPYPQPDDVFEITDPATLKILADSLRIQIMRAMRFPITVKEAAEEVKLPATKLYYHVNLLEKHKLIRVIDTNVVSGIIEKTYQITAHRVMIAEELLSGMSEEDGGEIDAIMSLVFDSAKRDLLRSIQAGLVQLDTQEATDDSCTATVTRGYQSLTPAQYKLVTERLETLQQDLQAMEEEASDSDETKMFSYVIAMFPVVVGASEDEQENS